RHTDGCLGSGTPSPGRVDGDRCHRMPLPLLIALFLAFGFDTTERVRAGAGLAQPGMSSWDAWSRVAATGGGLLLVAAFAFVLGKVVARRVERLGRASARVRRAYSLGVRGVDVLSLVVYGWVIHELDWPRVVRIGFRLGDPILIDDA